MFVIFVKLFFNVRSFLFLENIIILNSDRAISIQKIPNKIKILLTANGNFLRCVFSVVDTLRIVYDHNFIFKGGHFSVLNRYSVSGKKSVYTKLHKFVINDTRFGPNS